MKCEVERPCPGMTALNIDGTVKFARHVHIPGFDDQEFSLFCLTGRTYLKDGKTRIDQHILQYCPFCGRRLSEIIDNYAPPLLQETKSTKPKLNLL